MGTTPPTDLSQYPGDTQSEVPVVEGRSCSTCNSILRDGGVCLCTPTILSKPSNPLPPTAPKRKSHVRRQKSASETAVTPSDSTKPDKSCAETLELQPSSRRQLFKSESSGDIAESSSELGAYEAIPGTSGVSSQSTRSDHVTGSDKSEEKLSTTGSRTRHMCPRCPKSFSSPGKLSQHMYSHTGERPFVCQHCSKAFSSKFKLVRHALIHSDLRQYVCPICERTFHRKDHLKNHAKVHNPVKSLYTCDRPGCGKEYSSLINYKKHVAVHAAEDGNLECTMCGLKFSTKEEIIFHLKVHAGSRTVKTEQDRKYRCEWCNRSFFTGKDVRRHMVVHTGKRDFLCQYCPQRFGRKDHLVRHIKKSHNNTSKKPKTKRTEAKTESVAAIIAEARNPLETGKVRKTKGKISKFSVLSHTVTKPLDSSSEELLTQPSTSMLHADTSSLIFSSTAHPSVHTSPPAYSISVSPYDEIKSEFMPEDIKPEILPEFNIEHLSPFLSDAPTLQPHQSEMLGSSVLTTDESHQLSRHIMNLTVPSTSSDSDLIIPDFINPSGDQATPPNTTPLPRFNQAFHQQPP